VGEVGLKLLFKSCQVFLLAILLSSCKAVIKFDSNPTVGVKSTVSIIGAPDITVSNRSNYSVNGSCSEDGQSISVHIGTILVSPDPICIDKVWSTGPVDVSTLPAGSIIVEAIHEDAIPAEELVNVSVPAVVITSAPDINASNVAAYPVSGTCSENGETVTVNVGGEVPATQPVCTAGVWSVIFDVALVTDGSGILVSADHSDAASNPAVQANATVVKDIAIPLVAITSAPDVNSSNVVAYPINGTCSENGEIVTVNVGGQVPATQPVCTAGVWNVIFDVTLVADGVGIVVSADHSDAVANSAVQATDTLDKDASIPFVAITSAPDINASNVAAYPISGTCTEKGQIVTVNVGGQVPATQPTCTAGAWNVIFDVTLVADGTGIVVSADHSDVASNLAVQANATVVKDIGIPLVAITSAPDINSSNVVAYPISGTCSENGEVVTVNVGGQVPAAQPTCTAGAWNVSFDVSAVADGSGINVSADHVDAATNPAVQATDSVDKDATIPLVAITSAPDINASNVAAYPISGTCSENGETVTVNVGSEAPATQPTCTAGAWNVSFDVSLVADGTSIVVSADHVDAATNPAVQAADTVDKDTGIPLVAITNAPDIIVSNVAAYPISGTCSENGEIVTVVVGGEVPATQPTCTAGAWNVSFDVSLVADGMAINVSADHVDAATNPAVQATDTVDKDTGIPLVAITSAPDINASNVAAYPVSGTCSENGEIVTVVVGGEVPATQPTCTAGAWNVTFDVTLVADGAGIVVSADHVDAATNPAVQATDSVDKDATIPLVAITSAPDINASNVAAYPVSGTCSENGETVTVSVGGQVPATQPTCTAGTWNVAFDVALVADGTGIVVSADHVDAATNPAVQAADIVDKDTGIPLVSITTAPDINASNVAAYPISGTCSENGEVVSVAVGGQVPATQPTCTAGAWNVSFDVTLVADGTGIVVSADHNDAVSNPAVQAADTVDKDATIPLVAITSAPDINASNVAAYPISGTCSENGETVTVNVGGEVPATQPTCTAGAWNVSFDVSLIADGTGIVVSADHIDVATNPAVQATDTVDKDTGIPLVAITSAPDINASNVAAYPISGTCSENGEIVTVVVGGESPGTQPTCTAGAWNVSFDVSLVADGTGINVSADHSDAASNPAVQATDTVDKDTGIPLVAITSAPDINLSNVAAYPISGTCSENGEIVTVNVGGEVPATQPTCTAGAWNVSFDVSLVADGSAINVSADHIDAASNPAVQAADTVDKDTGIPLVAITSAPDINASNVAAYPISGTCSENGEVVTVNVGGQVPAAQPTCTAGAWNVSFDVSAVADGSAINVSADHVDAATNPAVQATDSVDKDATIPLVAITSAPDINASNVAAYPISGTCSENGEIVTVSVGGQVPATQPTCTAGAWNVSFDVSLVADGTSIVVSADHVDAATNPAVQATDTVDKDTGIPLVAITSASDINASNVAAYPISGTCSENGETVTVNVGGEVPATQPTCTAGAWNVAFDVTLVADGSGINVSADHSDAASNPAVQATDTVDKDTGIPLVAITSAPDINASNVAAYPISGTCSENGETVTVSVGGQVPATQPTCTAGAWNVAFDVTLVADGSGINVSADHVDAATNPAVQATDTVDKDTGIPLVAITSAPDINASNVAAYPISGTCSENGEIVTVVVGGESPGTQPTCTAGAWNVAFDVTLVADGTGINVSADHVDAATNPAVQATDTVDKDTGIPLVAITSAPDINASNVAAYPISGTCSENGEIVTVVVGGEVPATQPTCTAGAWNVSYDVSLVADGTGITVSADHLDAATNPAVQATDTVDKDATIPLVAITSAPDINASNVAAYPISGTCSENGETVTVEVGGQVPATQPTCSSGSWNVSFDVSLVADGTGIVVSADHVDAATNPAVQATDTVDKDTGIPLVAITSAPDINASNVTAYPISGTCSENGEIVTVVVGGESPGTQPTCTAGAWNVSFDVSLVADGTGINVSADHSDAASNPAVQATDTVDKDATLPLVAITSAPDIDLSNVAAYPISGTCSENGETVTVDVGGEVPATQPTCSSGNWNVSFDVSAVADGTGIVVSANHVDAASNPAVQATDTVDKDTCDPGAGPTFRVSVDSSGTQANNFSSYSSVSGDGRYVAFRSYASNLVLGDTNVKHDIFVHDRNTGTIERVSVDGSGTQANSNSYRPSISADGRYVAFESDASNLVAGDSNSLIDIFVHDRNTGVTELLSVDSSGTQANSVSLNPSISDDGRYIAFESSATNLVVGDSNGRSDIFVHDRNTGVTERVSVDSSGTQGNFASLQAAISGDGKFVSFQSSASNLVTGDSNGSRDIFVHNRNTAVTERVSVDSSGSQTNNYSELPSISDDGRYVAFISFASNLVSGDSNASRDVFVHDRNTGVTERISVDSSGTQANGTSLQTAISGDGRFVSFESSATNLVAGDSNGDKDIFVHDRYIGSTERVSVDSSGTQANNLSERPTISGDGRHVAFDSIATNLICKDTNTRSDIFFVDRGAIPLVAITSAPDINTSNVAAYPISGTCSENGETVTVDVGGEAPVTQPTCTAGAWNVSFDVSLVADGTDITVSADHSDASSFPATQATDLVDKDATIPLVAITSAPDVNASNAAAYPISGTCSENGETVTVVVGGESPGTQPTCTAGAWNVSFDVSLVADGTGITVSADHIDAASNPAVQATDTVDKDTGIPLVAITSAPDINASNVAAYPISGTCSENGEIVTVVVGGEVPATQPTCTAGAWNVSFDVSLVADGTGIAVSADHIDAASNPAVQATDSVDKDATIPLVAITSAPDINASNEAAYPISGTCSENGETVTVVVGGESPGTQPTCTAGAWNVSFDVSLVVDGTGITVSADHIDAASNPAVQATDTVDKDATIPLVAITSAPDINASNEAAYPISGTCSENGESVTVVVGGESPGTQPTCTAGAWNVAFDVTLVADGTGITVSADHSDAATNPAVQATDTVDKDTGIPLVAITSAPDIDLSNVAAYPISGTCSEDGELVTVDVGGESPGTQPTCSSGAWNVSFDVSAVADGTGILVSADHIDSASNPAVQATDTVDKNVCDPSVGPSYRVSIDSSGTQGNNSSYDSSISDDGRYVAFQSYATNLVAGDSNGEFDIFVHDQNTGVTERVSVDSSGTQGNSNSYGPSMSDDGRYIAFSSNATNLVTGDSNAETDIFVHDRNTGNTERVSIDSSGTQASLSSFQPSISGDGRYVAFSSEATNLVTGDSNGQGDIFVHDRDTGITERVSVDSSGTQANDDSFFPSITDDGRYVAFHTLATNLVVGDTNGEYDIFVHDRDTGITELVSVNSSGTQGNNRSLFSSMSGDGRYVAFNSLSTNLVAGDSNGSYDVFVHDRNTGVTERVSVDSSGTQGDDSSDYPSISGDGRYVSFQSLATNLVVGDSNGSQDVFIHDRNTGSTERVSVDSSGTQANSLSYQPSISDDGSYVAFDSTATNLICNDTNSTRDIFLRDLL